MPSLLSFLSKMVIFLYNENVITLYLSNMPLLILFFFSLSLYACYTDARYRVITNSTVLLAFCASLLIALQLGYLLPALGIASLCFFASVALWVLGFWGGGDAKLFPAMMLAISPKYAVLAIAFIGLLGGVTTLFIWLYCLKSKQSIKKIGIPYGIPISLSCSLFMFLSWLVL
ncbi:A24 family peptidase [Vibrio cidicii]